MKGLAGLTVLAMLSQAAEFDQLRSIVTATIATMGLESFNAETGSSFSLLSMVPVECDESEPTPNCIVRGTIGDGVESLDCNFSLFSEDDVAYIGTECDDGEEGGASPGGMTKR